MAGGNAHVPKLYELYVKIRKITGPDEQSVHAGNSLFSVKCVGNVKERFISSLGMSMDAEVQVKVHMKIVRKYKLSWKWGRSRMTFSTWEVSQGGYQDI